MTPGRLLYLARRHWKFGVKHWIAEAFLHHKIERWRPSTDCDRSPVPLHLLTSRADWRMALWMIASLHETTRLQWSVVLHEDGSLDDVALAAIARVLPDARIVRRDAADARMQALLANFPRCADYRRRMPHGLKAFDIPLMADADRFVMIDPDVLFFARPGKLLDWVFSPEDRSCWFNQDFQEPSPISVEVAHAELGIRLWPRVNSGLCLLVRESITDTAAMESWLERDELQNPDTQWRVEQTLLALSASRTDCGGLLPGCYEVSPRRHCATGCVARHYVGCVRDRFYGEGVFTIAQNLLGQ